MQATMAPEDRMSYAQYIAAISGQLEQLKTAEGTSPITVVDEQGKIVGARADTAAQKTAQANAKAASAQQGLAAQEAVRKLTSGQELTDEEKKLIGVSVTPKTATTPVTTTPVTTTPVTTTPVTTTPVTTTPVTTTPEPTSGKSPELIALEKAAADAEAQNQKVQAAYAKYQNKQPLTAEEKALLTLGADFEYPTTVTTTPTTVTTTPTTVTTTDTATATPTTAYTQEQLDAAIKAAQDKAIAELKAKTDQEKRDAEIAAAAALAAQNNKGGLTQADIDRAIREALAQQEAKAEALKREALAEADAKALAQKQKASDRLVSIFTGYGLETLAGFIDRRIKADVSEDMLLLELYDQPEYQLRFPGMKALRGKNRTITENDYMKIENSFVQTARFFDLPKGFYDSADDFGKLIGNEVSAKEFQDRLQVGQDLARSMSPTARAQLQEFYNVGEGGITAYVLDADRALSLIQKQSKAAQFVGFGREKGFKLEGMTAAQAEQIAGTEAYAKLSSQQLQQALGQAAQLRQTQSRLTGIEGEVYNENEALKAVIEGSPEALLASQQRAQREGARFGGGSGITGSSLRSTPGL
jgi:hypothetical protein